MYRAKHQPLGDAAEHAERRLELDVIEQSGAVLDGLEQVLMAERLERTLALLVDEAARPVPLGDRAGHRPRDAEMAGAPRDELAQPDQPSRHPADGVLVGTLERPQVGVDRHREVERRVWVDRHQRLGVEANHRRSVPELQLGDTGASSASASSARPVTPSLR